jgi:hypothetical protein
MPPKDARYHRERRSGVKKDKEEKRRLAKERGIESRARKRTFAVFYNADVAVEAQAAVGSMEVEGNEEVEEDNFHGAQPDAKWSEGDLVVLEDTRVGESSKLFWESLAVVKSRRCHDGQWMYNLDDVDYDCSYIYKDVPEFRIKDKMFSYKVIEGVRNDAEGKRMARRVVSQMENKKMKEVKKLKEMLRDTKEINELLHKEKTQRESELALKERQCDLLATEVAAIKNCDFYETLMHGHESDCPLVNYVVSEHERIFGKMIRKCREADALKATEDVLKQRCKLMKADLDERSLKLEEVKIQLENTIKQNKKLNLDLLKLLRENDKMAMEMLKDDNVDDDFMKVNRQYSFRYDVIILRLFVLGLSLKQVEGVLRQMFDELNVGHDIPGHSYLNSLRQDLGPICDIIAGLRLAKAKRYTQLGHDGSAIFENETLCVTVIAEMQDGSFEEIVLNASFLVEGKDAEVTHSCVILIFNRIREKYAEFALACPNLNLPPADEISLTKFATSGLMSDNNATALKVSQLIKGTIEAAVRAELLADDVDYDSLSQEEQQHILMIVDERCFSHIRCLCANDSINMENGYMKANFVIPEEWKGADYAWALQANVDSLVYACQKFFGEQTDTNFSYNKSVEFKTFFDENKLAHGWIYRSIGRKGTGSRMDMHYKTAMDLVYMSEAYLLFLESFPADKETIISKSIKLRLASPLFKAAIVTRARMYRAVYRPFRTLCQGNFEECEDDLYVYDMGRVCDRLYQASVQLREDPTWLGSIDWCVFSSHDFPCLGEHESDKKRKRAPESVELEAQRLFGDFEPDEEDDADAKKDKDDAVVEMINLTSMHAEGAIKALDHNAFDWMTHSDGRYAFGKWDEVMKSHCKSHKRENICLCEAKFGAIDYNFRKMGKAAKMGTVEGVVRSQMCGLFTDAISKEIFTTDDDVHAVLSFVANNRAKYQKERDEDFQKQKRHKLEKLKKTRLENQRKMQDAISDTIATFHLPRVTSCEKLKEEVSKCKSVAAKTRLLVKQLKIYVEGFGWREHKKPLSSKDDRRVGSVPDLLSRLEAIYGELDRGEKRIPTEACHTVERSILGKMDDVGYKYTASYAKIVRESLSGTVPEVFERMNRYKREYGVELEWPLHDLRELVWPKELGENELKFKRGTRIKYKMDVGKPLIEYEVLGLVWEDATGKKNDPLFVPQYYVWHYPVNGRKPLLAKEVKLYSQTITQLTEDGEKYRIAIQDFDNLEFCRG